MAFTQLDPPIPLEVLDKGKGLAIGMIDYGPEHNLIWVTAIDATGEIWCAPNPLVRMQANWTMGRAKAPDVEARWPVEHLQAVTSGRAGTQDAERAA